MHAETSAVDNADTLSTGCLTGWLGKTVSRRRQCCYAIAGTACWTEARPRQCWNAIVWKASWAFALRDCFFPSAGDV